MLPLEAPKFAFFYVGMRDVSATAQPVLPFGWGWAYEEPWIDPRQRQSDFPLKRPDRLVGPPSIPEVLGSSPGGKAAEALS